MSRALQPARIERATAALSEGLLVGLVVLATALLGILTRPIGYLAMLWPANAVLLGMFVRNPRLARPLGWLAAFLGFMAADLITGGELVRTVALTAANLAGVAVGFVLFQQVSVEDRRLRRPLSILYLLAISAAAAAASAVVGSGVSSLAFGVDLFTGTSLWFTSELVNNVIILPVILTAPAVLLCPHEWPKQWRAQAPVDLTRLAPLLALAASGLAGVVVGGPGAIAFPVPALIWCAVTYDLFLTVVVTLIYSIWMMAAYAAGVIATPFDPGNLGATMSLRLGITLLSLGPLSVASINAARDDLLRRLDRAANIDFLTGALTRSAFMERSQRMLDEELGSFAHFAVLAMDIDQFKRVNDSFGHAVGDRALMAFAKAATPELRAGDLFGRLGGEEFVAILPNVSRARALEMAEGMRRRVADIALPLDDGQVVQITVSIGVGVQQHVPGQSVDSALVAADQALYAAKAAGRNMVMAAWEDAGSRPRIAEQPPAVTPPRRAAP